MKRIVSLVLALSMVLSMFSFSFAGTTLPDVEGTDYEAAVSALVELGIVNGYEDGTYKADRTVTRAEMAKFLVVAAGLEPAADVSKGATKFSDVAADHWATGYINVASQYGYINGYPEGTFAPDATVSYAEAVTMAIRVLGYKTVVEAKGTWPTNYIAKAQELEVLDSVKYGKYTDGATRGNVALLMWNMLTTPMWDVDSENENNGLTYRQTGITMIGKYFEDYTYVGEEAELVVTDIEVEDGIVTVEITGKDVNGNTVVKDFDLATGIDFLNLNGRKVSILYNKEEEELVMITPSNDDTVVADYRNELSGDKYVLPAISGEKVWGKTTATEDTDYTVAVLGTKKNVQYATRYSIEPSIIVEELKTRNDEVRVNNGVLKLDEDVIVLIDGEWATPEDIEVGDILTELKAGELYIVSRDVVEGTFEAVTEEDDSDEYSYFVTVDGDEYSVVNGATSVSEIDEDGDEIATETLANIIKDDESKYYGEDVTLYLNFLGEVEKIEFAEVEDKEDAGQFYVLTNVIPTWDVSDKKGVTKYIELNGESYEVKAGVSVPATNVSGDVVYVEFDSKDRVEAIYSMPADAAAISEDYDMVKVFTSTDEILDDNNYISGDHKVTSSTVIVKITPVEDDEDNVEYYEVETVKGAEELEGIKYALVVTDADDDFNKAAYVFIWEDAKNTDKTYGIVEKYTKSNGIVYLTIDGTKYEVEEFTDKNYATLSGDLTAYVGRAVEFIENEDGINVTLSYATTEIAAAPVIKDVEDGRVFTISGDITNTIYDIDTLEDELEDVKVFLLNVSETDVDGEYEFDSFEELDFDDIKVKAEDRIALTPDTVTFTNIEDADTILIIRGYEA